MSRQKSIILQTYNYVKWQQIGHLALTKDWQYINAAEGRDFKIVYLTSPLLGRNSTGLVALVDKPENDSLESTEIFRPQRLSSYSIAEIIRFPQPPIGWANRLAIKQLVFSTQLINTLEVKIYMPVIDLTPDAPLVNPAISTVKNPVAVSIPAATTTAVRLLPVNATGSRKQATFYNASAKRTLYVDTDSTINIASAIAKVAPGKVYISDIPGWQGEYWGMLADGNDTTASNIAVEEYV